MATRASASDEVIRYHVELHQRDRHGGESAKRGGELVCPHGSVRMMLCECGDALFVWIHPASACGCEETVT